MLRSHLLASIGGCATVAPASTPHSIDEFVHGYEAEHRIRGFRSSCGFTTATWSLVCPQCSKADLEEVELSSRGKVVAFSVQTVPSDEFIDEAPYAYVVVELDHGGRLTGWMPSVRSEKDLELGARVKFVPSYKPGIQFVREEPAGDG